MTRRPPALASAFGVPFMPSSSMAGLLLTPLRVVQCNHRSKHGVLGASPEWPIFVRHVSISGGELLRTQLIRSWLGRRFGARSTGYIRGIVLLGKEDTRRCIGTTPRAAPQRGYKHPQQTSKPYSCLRAPLTPRSS